MADFVNQSTHAFIVDAVDIDRELLPFSLGHGLELVVTPIEHESGMKSMLDKLLAQIPSAKPREGRFESIRIPSPSGNGFSVVAAEPRYFGYQMGPETGEPNHSRLVALISRVCEVELVPGFTTHFAGNPDAMTVSWATEGSCRLLLIGTNPLPVNPVSVGQLHLDQLKQYVDLGVNLAADYPAITRSLEFLAEVDLAPAKSGAWFLGHFSALECLLTHKPSPTDTADSLMRQLKTSVPLLLRRAGMLERFGGTEELRKLIGKLYGMRSDLVHGTSKFGSPTDASTASCLKQFRNGNHQESGGGDWETACLAIREIVKTCLRMALEEPDLVTDLKGTARN